MSSDGTTLWGWGYNGGLLGDGTDIDQYRPVPIPIPHGVRHLVQAPVTTYAIAGDASLWGWGSNREGQMGDGTRDLDERPGTSYQAPTRMPVIEDVIHVASGVGAVYAVTRDGAVWWWGEYREFRPGSLPRSHYHLSPERKPIPGHVKGVWCTFHSAWAVTDEGTVWSWGANEYGELGDGTTRGRPDPAQVAGLSGVTRIVSCGGPSFLSSVFALREDGSVWAWGNNNYGQLGDGTTTNRPSPVRVTGLSDVTNLATTGGVGATWAVDASGQAWAWGAGYHGQLGLGTDRNTPTPTRIRGIPKAVEVVAAPSGAHAVCEDGSVWSWGENHAGQLGDGTTKQSNAPVRAEGLTGVTSLVTQSVKPVVYALTADGRVWHWGWSGDGTILRGHYMGTSFPEEVRGLRAVSTIYLDHNRGYAIGDYGS